MAGGTSAASKDWFSPARTGNDLLLTPELAGLSYFLYHHINGVEIFTGFERDKAGAIQIGRPLYKLITKDVLDHIQSNGHRVLCRMVPYDGGYLQFNKSPKLALPEYDECFILGPRASKENESVASTDTDQIVASSDPAVHQSEIYVGRLTEYSTMNSTGTKILRDMVKRTVEQDYIPPEYVTTAFIQQPFNAARVGTHFSSATQPRNQSASKSTIGASMDTGQRAQSQVRTSTPASSTGTSGTSGGNY
jgi:hypothetical protein